MSRLEIVKQRVANLRIRGVDDGISGGLVADLSWALDEVDRLTTLYESETRLHNEAADDNERLRSLDPTGWARLYKQKQDDNERLRRHRRYLNAVAIWFAFHESCVPSPDWVDPQGWSNCEPMIDEDSVDECERLGWNIEAAEEGGEKP